MSVEEERNMVLEKKLYMTGFSAKKTINCNNSSKRDENTYQVKKVVR